MRCELVEGMKTDPIGSSPLNTSGGNSEDFIRPQTRRLAGALYLESSAEEPG